LENLGPYGLPLSFYGAAAVVALAALLFVAWRNCCRQAAFWIALLLAGQACALELLWAGPHIRLQMFRGWGELLRGPRAIFFAAFLLQTTIVLWGARKYWPAIRRHLPKLLSWPQALLLLLLLAYSATTIAPEWAQALAAGHLRELAVRSASHGTKVALGLLISVTSLLNLVLAVATIPATHWDRVVAWWRASDRHWIPWAAAAWVVILSSLLAWVVLERVPHVPDEVCYIFQAKYFAEGRLSVPAPPDERAFFIPFTLIENGRWYAATTPGWPALLAVGYFFGVPWLVNPLLGGIAILLAHTLVHRLYGRGLADGTALLLAASPWLLWMSASLMPHPATLVFALVALLGAERAREQGSLIGGALAGLGCGALLHVRPLEGVIAAAVAGLWWLGQWRKLRMAALAATLTTGGAMAALFLAYNQALTGSATQTPINKYLDQTFYPGVNRLGFGADVGNMGWRGLDALPGHGPIDVFMNSNQNLHLVNLDLFGWWCGSLLFVYGLVGWRHRHATREFQRADRVMWGLLLGVIAGLNLYWFAGGADFGARYWYLVILPGAVLTLRGAQVLSNRMQAGTMPPEGPSRAWAFVALATAVGVLTFLPWRSLDKYWHYRGTSAAVRELAHPRDFGRRLVIIRGYPWPDYASASYLNPPLIAPDYEGPIYALDPGPESVSRLRAAFPNHSVLIIGPSSPGQ
jgi:4-amino-4-deoxy-L-arabinose transferase-like glycosyltransferase